MTARPTTAPRWRRPLAALAALAAALFTLGGVAALGQGQDEPAPASNERLVDRLVEIERQLPALPPDAVLISDDETWAELTGDFTGAEVQLATLADSARTLFTDADDAGGEVGDAVADAARAILLFHEAYVHLAEWESHDLAFPLDTFDSDGVATGADELAGEAELGLDLVLAARALQLPAYEVLASTGAADGAEKSFFETQLAAAEAFDAQMRPRILAAISDETSQEALVVSRFDTLSPGDEPRARSVTITCIDSAAYAAAFESGEVDDLATLLAAVDPVIAADCPDLPAENQVQGTG